MKVVPSDLTDKIMRYIGTSMFITSGSSAIVCIAMGIIDVLYKHRLINFRPNWFEIGEIGSITIMSNDFFVIYLSGRREGELSFNVEHKEGIGMVFSYRYDPDVVPILFQGLNLYDLIRLCKSLKSKSDPFYDMCKNNINFWKLKAIEFCINRTDLPDNSDPLALRKIIQLIRDRVKERIKAIRMFKCKTADYIKLLTEYPSPEIEDEIVDMAIYGQRVNLIKIAPLLSENSQIRLVRADGKNIRFIENPSIKVQIAGVRQRGGSITFIENPSFEVQLAAVQENYNAIQYIKNPHPEVQIAAVQASSFAIAHIENPTIEAQLEAVRQYPGIIVYIKNPSLEAQLAAVSVNGSQIHHIANPSLEVQLAAVKQDPKNIKYIKNQFPEVKRFVAEQKAKSKKVKSVKKTSKKVK